jgi:hypothetical protein
MNTDEHLEWLSNQLAMATKSLKIQMAVKEMAFKEVDELKAGFRNVILESGLIDYDENRKHTRYWTEKLGVDTLQYPDASLPKGTGE